MAAVEGTAAVRFEGRERLFRPSSSLLTWSAPRPLRPASLQRSRGSCVLTAVPPRPATSNDRSPGHRADGFDPEQSFGWSSRGNCFAAVAVGAPRRPCSRARPRCSRSARLNAVPNDHSTRNYRTLSPRRFAVCWRSCSDLSCHSEAVNADDGSAIRHIMDSCLNDIAEFHRFQALCCRPQSGNCLLTKCKKAFRVDNR